MTDVTLVAEKLSANVKDILLKYGVPKDKIDLCDCEISLAVVLAILKLEMK